MCNSNANKLAFIDSETIGLHGMMILLQFAIDDGDINLWDVWKKPVGETLDLIEWLATHTVVGFNLTFDWFHIVKIYTVFSLCPRDWIPEEHIEEIALLEPLAQNGPCIKPVNALDLLLHSRKGQYQALMARSDIRIRRVPNALAYALAEELEKRVQIDGIYFAKSHDKDAPKWQVFDIKNREGEFDSNFKDVVLRFNPAGGLKFLAEHALGYKPKYIYTDVEIDRKYWPKELGYAPIALATSTPDKNWEVWTRDKKTDKRKLVGYSWPALIKHHIEHWHTREDAREYASDDIKYTRELYYHFEKPEAGDDDSVLACMVPVIRWRGFKTNNPGIRILLDKAQALIDNAPVNVNKPTEVRAYIGECMDDMEKLIISTSTKKANIKAVSMWEVLEEETCTKCSGEGHHESVCKRCEGTGKLHAIGATTTDHGNHPAAIRADELLTIKVAAKEVELYKKLLRAGKFHASFVVIGTLSTRMSGADGLNAQGIKSTKEVRAMFPLAWDPVDIPGYKKRLEEIIGERWTEVWERVKDFYIQDMYQLCGGDFDSFEVTLADAVYQDPDLRKALVTKVPCHKCDATGQRKGEECGECDGTGRTTKKIHALFGMCLFPGKTYEEIVASAGTSNDMYSKGKQGVFAMIYGGDFNTLVRNLGIPVDTAAEAFETWNKWFPRSAKARERTFKAFCSMKQPGGLGTQVIWGDPDDYVESFLGFRRYFTLENMITKELFKLANGVPKAWKNCKIKVLRRQKVQTAGGAVSSAVYGAAFQIQAANQRAAANHEIQSPGGQLTKALQRAIWDLQPVGVNVLLVAPMNVHDELMCVTHPDYVETVATVVRDKVESFRPKVPLIGMTWNKAQENWAEKKGGSVTVKIRAPELALAA
jgi:hypothetical protein